MAHNPLITNPIPGEYRYPFRIKTRTLSGDYFVNLTPVTSKPLCEVASSGLGDID
ncbi:MAG: Aldehyde dehydrogenase B [Sodalis sp.]|nr:MAG: Aldehyde dehydrogenase B [Sodalis sp.]